MKKILLVIMIFLFFESVLFAENRYNASDDQWQNLVYEEYGDDGYIISDISSENVYGNNCKAFVRRVCRDEGRGRLGSTNYDEIYGDSRLINGTTPAEGLQWTLVGKWLNDERGERGPTAEELRDTVFANARSGDIVQMHWYGTGHTALINDITDEGVTYFQSNTHPDGLAIIESHLYKWEELSEIYKANSKECGLTIYRFGNPIIEPKDLTHFTDSAKFNQFKEIDINCTGQVPIRWHIISGDLPPGMDLQGIDIPLKDSSFGSAKIAGTPRLKN